MVSEQSQTTQANHDDLSKIRELLDEHMQKLDQKLENAIDEKFENTISEKIPKAVEECVKNMTAGVDSSVNDSVQSCLDKVRVAVSDQVDRCMEQVDNKVSHKVEECITQVQEGVSASVDSNMNDMWTEVIGRKRNKENKSTKDPNLITSAMKRAILEQKSDDINRDERMKNLIIYRLPESTKETAEERKADEAEKIAELLDSINVESTPEKIFRIGRFDEKNKTNPRPIKVIMKSVEDQNKVMTNAKLLANADEDLKKLSIAYDMTEEERALVKDKVDQAKEKSKNSKNWVYKVRGPYWNLREIRVKKDN